MSEKKKLKEQSFNPFKICYNCYEVQEGKKEGNIPESCNDCLNCQDVVPLIAINKFFEDLVTKIETIFEHAAVSIHHFTVYSMYGNITLDDTTIDVIEKDPVLATLTNIKEALLEAVS